jgi:5-methylcytosine-specific restriction protein A
MPRIPMLGKAIPQLNGRSVQLPPKQRADIYGTPEHTAWAKQVVLRANKQCAKCGATHGRMYADHIKELRDGGTYDMSNSQCLCASCHTSKTMIERAKRALHEWKGL